MKKSFIVLIALLVSAILAGCIGPKEEKWEAYASLIDNKIVPFEENFKGEGLKNLKSQTLVFKKNGVMVKNIGSIEIKGMYRKTDNGYTVKMPLGDSSNSDATLDYRFFAEDLVETLETPEGWSEYDTGDPIVYKRVK